MESTENQSQDTKTKDKKKVLVYVLGDGRTYHLDRHVVAHDRANHYAQRDKDTTYQEEYDYIMSDEGEDCMWDWVKNNMDWYEHNPVLIEAGHPEPLSEAEVEDTYVSEVEVDYGQPAFFPSLLQALAKVVIIARSRKFTRDYSSDDQYLDQVEKTLLKGSTDA